MVKRFEPNLPSRSQKYQHLLIERCVEDTFLASFTNEDSVYGWLNPNSYNERRMELEDKIKERFYLLLKEHATKIQYDVFMMTVKGMTQVEICKVLNCNQSGICKALYGNSDYNYRKITGVLKKYGGLVNKMKKVIAKDDIMQDLLTELNEDYM